VVSLVSFITRCESDADKSFGGETMGHVKETRRLIMIHLIYGYHHILHAVSSLCCVTFLYSLPVSFADEPSVPHQGAEDVQERGVGVIPKVMQPVPQSPPTANPVTPMPKATVPSTPKVTEEAKRVTFSRG